MGWRDTIRKEEKSSAPSWRDTIIDELPSTEAKKPGLKSYREDIGITKEDLARSDETVQDILTTLPQGITTWSDEMAAGISAGVRKALGETDPYEKLYEQDVTAIRNDIARARQRSPIATMSGELGTGVAASFVPGVGVGKLSGAGGTVSRAALEGWGTSEDKLSTEGAVNAGIGGAMGAAGSLISGGLKKLTTGNPNKIRANVLGARSSEFKEIGTKEREQVAKKLKDMGLFSNTKVDFDVKAGKFIPVGKSLENLEKPVREKLFDRLNSATNKIQKEKTKMLLQHMHDPVDLAEVEDSLMRVAERYSKKGTGRSERLSDAMSIKDKIIEDIALEMEDRGMEVPTIEMIENAKLRLSDDVSNYGKNPLIQKTPDAAQIYNDMYSAINKKLRQIIPNAKYAEYNDLQHKMLTAKADLTKAIATEDAARTTAGWGGWFNKIANETLGSPEAGLGVANVSEALQNPAVSPMVTGARMVTQEAPFMGSRYLDPSMKETEIPYSSEAPHPTQYRFQNVRPAFPFGRKPQSIDPMEVAKMKLPRTTEGLLQNKEAVIAKLMVNNVPDEMVQTITQALNEDPSAVSSVGAMIAMQFPTLFQQSKYKMFDGKLLDPQERAKAADDTSKRDDLNSLQKSKIINELNKTGKWLGE